MKTWLKGGLWGLGIGLFFLLDWLIIYLTSPKTSIIFSEFVFITIILIIFAIILFIIGAIIGWTVGSKRINIIFKGAIIGGIVGIIPIWKDYDFFINFGGPSPTLSRAINNFFGLSTTRGILVPFAVSIFFFAIIGLIIGLIISKIKDGKK